MICSENRYPLFRIMLRRLFEHVRVRMAGARLSRIPKSGFVGSCAHRAIVDRANNAWPNISTAVQQMIYRLPQPALAAAARERRRDRKLEEGVPYATPG